MGRLWPWALVLLALLPTVLVHVKRPAAPSHVRSGITVAVVGSSATVDPASSSALPGRLVADNVFQTLFRLNPNGTLSPDLALSATGGGTLITLRLSPARLSNGVPVTASVVAASLARTLWPGIASPLTTRLLSSVVGITRVIQGKSRTLAGLTAVSAHVLQIHLKAADSGLLYQLANPALAIVPVSDLAQGGAYWQSTNLIGSGGYRLFSQTPNASMQLNKVKGSGPNSVSLQRFPTFEEAALSLVNGQTQAVPVSWLSRQQAIIPPFRKFLRWLPTGGQVTLKIYPLTGSPWLTTGGGKVLQAVSAARWVKAAFAGMVPADAVSWPTLSAPPAAASSPTTGHSSGSASHPALPSLGLTVSSQDAQALVLARALTRLYPGHFTVTVLSPARLAAALQAGTLPAVLASTWAGTAPATAKAPTSIQICPTGVLWLLRGQASHPTAFQDGALNWQSFP